MYEYTMKLTLADKKQRIISIIAENEKEAMKLANVTKTEILWESKVRTWNYRPNFTTN